MKHLDPNSGRYKTREHATETTLTPSKPIIIRLDGKAFHTFTKQPWCDSPFSTTLARMFEGTLQYLCENIQGCVLGYHQSDEMTLVLTQRTPESEMFLGGRVQKIVSVVASMGTMRFNELYQELVPQTSRCLPAVFDARVFQVDDAADAAGCVRWRADDAVKNSKHMLARSVFTHHQLHGKSSSEMVDMMSVAGVDYYAVPGRLRCGSLCVRRPTMVPVPVEYAKTPGEMVERHKWVVEEYTPETVDAVLTPGNTPLTEKPTTNITF